MTWVLMFLLLCIGPLERGQRNERIWDIYNRLKDDPLVRWKESIKKIVGIPLETESGTDR